MPDAACNVILYGKRFHKNLFAERLMKNMLSHSWVCRSGSWTSWSYSGSVRDLSLSADAEGTTMPGIRLASQGIQVCRWLKSNKLI